MIGSRLLPVPFLVGLLAACGSGSANLSASGSVNAGRDASESRSEKGATTSAESVEGEPAKSPTGATATEAPPPPVHDPKLVVRAVDESAEGADDRRRLGLRLSIVEQGSGEPWLLAVVNRGTESLTVQFDLRTLSLEVVPPAPQPEADPKSARVRSAKPPKPTLCALPKEVVPTRESESFEIVLEPGEGVVDSFDPRLYCLPAQGATPLVPGATVTARLGFTEKTKTVWVKGKSQKKVVEQLPPFVARLTKLKAPEPAPPLAESPEDGEGSEELAFERYAVKQLVAKSFQLAKDYEPPPQEGDAQPLALRITRGSDARTEREAIITVSLVNESPKAQTVYFRRELVSFEIAGPTGLIGCDAGPDERAPERLSFATLGPGKNLSASSRLIELCPQGALRVPGLYMIHGRFEAKEGGEEFGLSAFRGLVFTDEPALVRVRKGWGDMPAQQQPLRVRVGGAPPEAAPEKPSP
jgi:hypothetical protein